MSPSELIMTGGSESPAAGGAQSAKLQLDRRDFLKVLGGGLLVCLSPMSSWTQESGRSFGGHELPKDINAWLHIDSDGRVKVFTGKVEVGQNIRTSLAQAVAEELHVPFDSITMIMGDTDLVPWDMGTFGSRTTPTMAPQLRNMAVAGRQMLLEMAAQRWNTDAAKLIAEAGKISTPDGSKSLTYGELTRGENLVQTVGDPPLTPATEWKIAGTPVPKAYGRDFVTGKHKFPSDIVRPEMMFGAVLRPQGFNATLAVARHQRRRKDAGREGCARRRFHRSGRRRCVHGAAGDRCDPGQVECARSAGKSRAFRVPEE